MIKQVMPSLGSLLFSGGMMTALQIVVTCYLQCVGSASRRELVCSITIVLCGFLNLRGCLQLDNARQGSEFTDARSPQWGPVHTSGSLNRRVFLNREAK